MNVIPSFFSVRVIVAVFKVFFAISTVISSLISDHIFNIPWTFSKSLMSILNVAHFDCPMSYFLQFCSNFEFTVASILFSLPLYCTLFSFLGLHSCHKSKHVHFFFSFRINSSWILHFLNTFFNFEDSMF